MVAGAEIDILVDIAGLSMGGRLGVFAHKPAPIQVTAWGFPVGTGLPQIDWIMADRLFIRPEEQGGMAERVWYVSNWAGYAPPGADLIPSATPAKSKGHLTFGVFCRTEKITRAALGVWRRILDRVPSARFLLKSSSIKHDNHVAAIQRFFGQAGIDPSRLIVMGESNKEEHLRCHLGVDIALDAFPQVGGISTFEALWTGVPVVTLYGHVPSSRGAASILNAVGLPETIAQSPDHYVEIAVGLSSDLDRLERLRAECRPRLLASPAGNPQLYVAEVEAAFRDMWSLWCARPQV
jgi:predicted O-linked N-acetylglucosamine transferase (SPINDLY family)